VHEVNHELDIRVYPNPNQGLLFFSGDDFTSNTPIELIDLNGNILKRGKVRSNQFEFEDISPGIYFVHLLLNDARYVVKIVLL